MNKKWVMVAFWFSYTTMLPGEAPKTTIVGPFNEPTICIAERDKQVARLAALHDRNQDLQWAVTPGVGDDCDTNHEGRRPR